MYFTQYFAEFFLNICIFLKKFNSSCKKIHSPKTAEGTLRRINFRWVLPWQGADKCDFSRLDAGEDAKIYRRRACVFDFRAANHNNLFIKNQILREW